MARNHDQTRNRGTRTQQTGESLGVTVPDDHVGAFVAEAFEDVELDTTWTEVVDALVADEARAAWDDLSATERVVEVLAAADDYDERAVEHLAAIPIDRGAPTPEIREEFDEAMRCRRNADRFRDGVAAAYDDGLVDDDDLVTAVEAAEFDTARIADREERLERVANAFDFEFRPYGGTLMHDEDGTEDGETEMDDFEAW